MDGRKIKKKGIKKKETGWNQLLVIAVSPLRHTFAAVLTVALRGLHKQKIRTARHVLMHKPVTTAVGFAAAAAQAPEDTKKHRSYSFPAHLLTRFCLSVVTIR